MERLEDSHELLVFRSGFCWLQTAGQWQPQNRYSHQQNIGRRQKAKFYNSWASPRSCFTHSGHVFSLELTQLKLIHRWLSQVDSRFSILLLWKVLKKLNLESPEIGVSQHGCGRFSWSHELKWDDQSSVGAPMSLVQLLNYIKQENEPTSSKMHPLLCFMSANAVSSLCLELQAQTNSSTFNLPFQDVFYNSNRKNCKTEVISLPQTL